MHVGQIDSPGAILLELVTSAASPTPSDNPICVALEQNPRRSAGMSPQVHSVCSYLLRRIHARHLSSRGISDRIGVFGKRVGHILRLSRFNLIHHIRS